ncbi:MAG: hypothetical protein L0215_27135 [Gemmataceae bacterium]|nr:hypothetical protein [Gemmataceae bacterium]
MRCLLAFLFGISLAPGALPQEKPARIPVVKTWEELQAPPPIDLGDGVKIRLGLEADKFPQWSGASEPSARLGRLQRLVRLWRCLLWQEAEILADIELHSVNLGQESGNGSAVIGWVFL